METTSTVLVCITPQLSCEKIITYGKDMAQKLNSELCVVSAIKKDPAAKKVSEALKILNALSKKCSCNI